MYWENVLYEVIEDNETSKMETKIFDNWNGHRNVGKWYSAVCGRTIR